MLRCCPNCPNPSTDSLSGHISVLPDLLIFRGFLIFAGFLFSSDFWPGFGKFGAKVLGVERSGLQKPGSSRNILETCGISASVCSALQSRAECNVEMKKKSHRKSGCLICCSGIEGCLVQTIRVKWRTNYWYNLYINLCARWWYIIFAFMQYRHNFQIDVNCFPSCVNLWNSQLLSCSLLRHLLSWRGKGVVDGVGKLNILILRGVWGEG